MFLKIFKKMRNILYIDVKSWSRFTYDANEAPCETTEKARKAVKGHTFVGFRDNLEKLSTSQFKSQDGVPLPIFLLIEKIC